VRDLPSVATMAAMHERAFDRALEEA